MKLRILYRDFKIGIRNLIKWFPIIWKDHNWDSWYIFNILEHKLKAQAKYIGDHNFYVGAKRDAEIMMLCVRLIHKVKEEYYNMEHMDYQNNEIVFEPVKDNSKLSEIKIIHHENTLQEYFDKYPLIYKKVISEGYRGRIPTDDYSISSYIADMNHDRARKLLFKILEEHIERWWD